MAAFRGAGARFASVPNDSGYPEGVETHIITTDAFRTADGEALSAPGPVETGMVTGKGYDPAQMPLGRMAKPEEIAAMALFLLGPGIGYATGAVFDITGGTYIR